MKKNEKIMSALVAAFALGGVAHAKSPKATATPPAEATTATKGHCENSCKGKGGCKSKSNATCAGHNGCAGQGKAIDAADQAACTAKKGVWKI